MGRAAHAGRSGNPQPVARARGEANCPDPAWVESQMVGTFCKGFLQSTSWWSGSTTGDIAKRPGLAGRARADSLHGRRIPKGYLQQRDACVER